MMQNKKGNVLYSTYPTAFNFFGGGEVQLLKTKEYVEKVGSYSIKLFDIFIDKLEDYDILHNFSMSHDCLSLCKMAKKRGVKIAISPIYWKTSEYSSAKVSSVEKLLITLKEFYYNLNFYGIPTFRTLFPFKDFLELADIILPNSRMEAALLANEFKINKQKFYVVPNGAEKKVSMARPDFFVQNHNLEDFILFVGRIERRKNVLALLKACKNMKMPLVLIGHYSERDYRYFKECKKIANSNRNIHYLGFIPPDSEELFSAYAAAKVFVLPSWYETPGLSALEAGLAGCNIVITDRGSTTEYFKDYAWYVNPASTEDIRKKILEAYENPKSRKLRKLILDNYTWEKVAQKTLEAYDLIYD